VTTSVEWHSDDTSIASPVTAPDYLGTFVAGHVGSTKVRAKLGSMTSTDVTVTVLDLALLAIDLSDAHLNLFPGSNEYMGASGTFQDGSQVDISRSVVWKTGNPAVATVSNDPNTVGVVTAVAKGTTSLTATLGSVSTTTTVTVN
jgi:Bacterial Ig-like domain (group 2)